MPSPRKADPKKHCDFCGKLLARKSFNGRLEDMGAFRLRRFCNRICGNSRKVVTMGALYYRAAKHRKKQCEACGFTRKLHAHHVDGDETNNSPENIQTLCTHCHNFWHALLSRRGLPIGGRMPVLLSRS